MRFPIPTGIEPLIWLPCRSRAQSSPSTSMLGGMLPVSRLCERSRRVRVLKAEKLRDSSAPLSRIPRREMPMIANRCWLPCTLVRQLMPRHLQAADMFPQERAHPGFGCRGWLSRQGSLLLVLWAPLNPMQMRW